MSPVAIRRAAEKPGSLEVDVHLCRVLRLSNSSSTVIGMATSFSWKLRSNPAS